MNENYIESLERELKLSKVELEMLNKTYEETLERGGYMDIKGMKEECLKKSKYIYDLQERISKFHEVNNLKPNISPINGSASVTNIPDYEKNVTCTRNDFKTEFDKVVDELQTNLGKCTKNNRFLVHMLDIPSDMICSAEVYEKNMILQIYNFINDANVPIYANLEYIKQNDRQFDITIEFLDSCGSVMYKEMFKGCKINGIMRSTLDYNSDDFTKNNIYLTYDEITYENRNDQENKFQGL